MTPAGRSTPIRKAMGTALHFQGKVWYNSFFNARCWYFLGVEMGMTKEKLVEKITELLKTDMDLRFLLELKKEEIETLVACIRDRVDNPGE